MENPVELQSCGGPMKENPADAAKAKKVVFWLYLLTAVGILLPLVLFAIFG
jgi:hypothetical protein